MWTILSSLVSRTQTQGCLISMVRALILPRDSKRNGKAEHSELYRLLVIYCLQPSEFKSKPNHVSYGLPHLSSPTGTKRTGSLPVLSPVTTPERYSRAAGLARQYQKRKTTPALASAGELTIGAVHSTDQIELQIIPAFFATVTQSTQAVSLSFSPNWGNTGGSLGASLACSHFFKMAF